MRNILVTTALPYASGALHLGHILENIQADIWVRTHKLLGHHCLLVSGCDAHGTAIMLTATKQGISPEQLIDHCRQQHWQHLQEFFIDLDIFYTTHSPENLALVTDVFTKHTHLNNIYTKTIEQAYDRVAAVFLPDRFIKGTCPHCGSAEQYGDNCEQCGSVYSPSALKEPYSILSNTAPINKESLHYFFKLSNYTEFLRTWTTTAERLPAAVKHKLNEWLTGDLLDWDISRDAPYFGFNLPQEPDKYYYCWLDAPLGYIAATQKLLAERNLNYQDYWAKDSSAEVYHFIGKDIIYFHALFWPALLEGAGLRTPTGIKTHGFLTINGQKMSKSRGTFITAAHYLEHLPAELLRYYFASKLNNSIDDLDVNFTELQQRINADLIGKFVNIASRLAGFIERNFAGYLGAHIPEHSVYHALVAANNTVAKHWQNLEYSQAIKVIMALADQVNKYISDQAPWVLARDNEQHTQLHEVCTVGLNCFIILSIYLKAVLPVTVQAIEALFNIPPLSWQDLDQPLLNHYINPYTPLLGRVTNEQIAAISSTNT